MTVHEPANLALDEQLCFALYAASRAITGCYRPLLDDLGLTYPQYLVMLVLWEDGEVPVNHLAGRLQLETGTLSPLLKRLEAIGMITRTRSVDDERSVRIAITPAGDALREGAGNVPRSMLQAIGMELPDIIALRDTLRALTARLRNPA